MRRVSGLALLGVALLAIFESTTAVKDKDFKICAQSGFCRRNRAFADHAAAAGLAWTSPYELEADSIKFTDGVLTGTIWKAVEEKDGGRVELPLTVTFLDDGVARLTIDEGKRQRGEIEMRGDSTARKERYNEAGNWALVGGKNIIGRAFKESSVGETKVRYGDGNFQVVLQYSPFKATFWKDGKIFVVFNDRGLLNVDHWRPKREKVEGEPAQDESTWWEETFGGNTDTKPRGWFGILKAARLYVDGAQVRNPSALISLSLGMTLFMAFLSTTPVFPLRRLVEVKETTKNRTVFTMPMSLSTSSTRR